MKYGQMPMVTLDGVEHFQSFAVLRFLAKELGDGSLYPCCAKDALKVSRLRRLLRLGAVADSDADLDADADVLWSNAVRCGSPNGPSYRYAMVSL